MQKKLMLQFADDTIFQIFGQNPEKLVELANIELVNTSLLFKANKLTLNIGKTKYNLFHKLKININFENLPIKIEDTKIDKFEQNCPKVFQICWNSLG